MSSCDIAWSSQLLKCEKQIPLAVLESLKHMERVTDCSQGFHTAHFGNDPIKGLVKYPKYYILT